MPATILRSDQQSHSGLRRGIVMLMPGRQVARLACKNEELLRRNASDPGVRLRSCAGSAAGPDLCGTWSLCSGLLNPQS